MTRSNDWDVAEAAPAPAPAHSSLGFACHVIPTGVVRDHDDLLIAATLAFTPTAGDDLLKSWPSGIARRLNSMRVSVRAAGATVAYELSEIENLHEARAEAAKIDYAKLLGAVDALWAEAVLLGRGGGDLQKILAESRAGKSNEQLLAKDAPATAAPDIVAIPRGDMALLYALQRAKAVADRAHEASTPPSESPSKPETACRLNLGLSNDWFARPWARLPNPLERRTLLAMSDALRARRQLAAADADPVLVAQAAAAAPAPAAPNYSPFRYSDGHDGSFKSQYDLLGEALKLEHQVLRPEVEKKLVGSRKVADDVSQAKRAVGATKPDAQAETIEKALKSFGRARAKGVSADAASKTCVGDPQYFHQLCDERLAVHVASSMPDADEQAMPTTVAEIKHRWMAVQTQPSLMRLFHLVVDVRFRLPAARLAALAPEGQAAFLEFGIAGVADGDALWVLCKLVPPKTHGGAGRLWPATRAEWLQTKIGKAGTASDVRDYGAIDQIEGVYDLGAAFLDSGTDGAPLPGAKRIRRFDVASLDVVDAAEVTVQEHKTQATTVADSGKPGCARLPSAEVDDVLGTRTRRTAGLVLIDRWRQSAAVSQFVRSGEGVAGVKDADDLTTGFKIDIGVYAGAPGASPSSPGSNWRSLTDRHVAMSLPVAFSDHPKLTLLKGEGLDRAMNALAPSDPGLDRKTTRRRIDGAIVTIPARLRGNGKAHADSGAITAFAEEVVTGWDGDPLGLRCGEGAVGIGAGGLPINMNFSLPTRSEGPKLAPHRLRLGAAYRFGARAVLVGGVSRPLKDAAALYDSWLDGDGLSLPGPQSQEFRRFLRHERVDAPMVAIEQTHLLAELATDRPPLDGKEMIVRSSSETQDGDQGWRYGPSETSRVIFAPPVSLSFATWHGVFDAPAGGVSQTALLGGLSSVDYDAEWIGFPVLEPDAPPVESSVRCNYREGEKPDPAGLHAGRPPSGTAVVRKPRVSLAERCKQNRYHPDPAARFMVVALKRPDGDYLDDPRGAICVPLYAGAEGTTKGYPDALPVVLKIKADKTEKAPLTSYAALRRRAKVENDHGWPRIAIDKTKPLSNTNAAVEVTIVLRPGEDFQVETWCVPDKTLLARWFDVPESLALLVGGSPSDGACTDLKTCRETLTGLTGLDPSDLDRFRSLRVGGSSASCGKGDCKATLDLVKGVAGALVDLMKRRPIPEIAAVRRFRAVHAVEAPNGASEFAQGGVRILRVTKATRKAIFEKSAPEDPDDVEAAKRLQRLFNWTAWKASDDDFDATELLVGGELETDFESTDRVELRATAAAARGQPMDDPSRGRSPADRLAGVWSCLSQKPAPAAEEGDRHSLAERLFGFDVDQTGVANLPTQTVRIAEWTIPGSGSAIGRKRFDMLDLSRLKGLDGHYFADGKARRLSLDLYATSRTALLISTRSLYPTKSEEDEDGRRLFVKGAQSVRDLILRATVRPSALKAHSLLPVFVWKPEGSWLSRKTKIRVRCARPHFTSGVEERWGVVLWPPNMFDVKRKEWKSEDLRAGRMRRQEPVASGDPEYIDLFAPKAANDDWREAFFTDDDLGKGGKYVTRWGLDPIRKGGSLGWFLSPEALADETTSTGALRERRPPSKSTPLMSALPVDATSADDEDSGATWIPEDSRRPRLVENVLMPIPVDEKATDAVGTDPSFMQVSLMTYEPRFDPDFEHWYIDIDIAPGLAVDPFLRLGVVRFQPHARRELQCSSPIAEWVQIVGYARRVNAEVTADGAGVRTVTVKVSGPAPTDADDEAQLSFRATLYERWRSPLGHVAERAVRGEAAGEDGIGDLVAVRELTFQKGDDLWTGDLDLPTGAGATYAVLVEEVNRMRPAQHAIEPHDDSTDGKTSVTGPRFAAFIDLLTPNSGDPVVARF